MIVWETIYYVFYIILLCSCFFGAYSLISSFKVRYSADLGPFLRFLMDARETKKKTEENNPLKFFFLIFSKLVSNTGPNKRRVNWLCFSFI